LFIDPELVKERLRPGGRKLSRRLSLLIVPSIAHWIVAGLDMGRYHWSPPLGAAAQAIGLCLVAGSLALSTWAMHVNRFFSSVIRIQTERGHTVISTGPYAWVRHPGYAAGLLHVAISGLALGSVVSILPHLTLVPFLLCRVVEEDRTLKRELPGYAGYAGRVRFRLLPGIW
jgi:protein-S-isoprenylcysteine O-methyltransferase Ste14